MRLIAIVLLNAGINLTDPSITKRMNKVMQPENNNPLVEIID
jgi:hypothetical protein